MADGVNEFDRAGHVVAPILHRVTHGFADVLVCREMDDLIDPVIRADLSNEFGIGNVANDQRGVEQGISATKLERIQNDDIAANCPQLSNRVRSDVSGTSGDENRHGFVRPSSRASSSTVSTDPSTLR